MICFRLLDSDDPATPLAEAVAKVRDSEDAKEVYSVNPSSFRQIPNAPFAYWVSEKIRRMFIELPPFEGDGRTMKVGLQTGEDFRFVRTAWETPKDATHQTWFPFAKGGSYSPFYADVHLHVNWRENGAEIRFLGDPTGVRPKSRPQNTQFYFLPGLTWSDRTTKLFSTRIWPRGGIFSVKGSCGFFEEENTLALGLMNSRAFNGFLSMMVGAACAAARSYQVGTIGRVPAPLGIRHAKHGEIAQRAGSAWSLKRNTDTANLNSHAFHAPALLPNLRTSTSGSAQ